MLRSVVPLALLVCASSAQAIVIPLQTVADRISVVTRSDEIVPIGGSLPWSFTATSSLDTDTLVWSLGSFLAAPPPQDLLVQTGTFQVTGYYDPPGFEPVQRIDLDMALSINVDFGDSWLFLPTSSTATLDPQRLDAYISFAPIVLGSVTFTYTGTESGTPYIIHISQLSMIPALHVKCSDTGTCYSWMNLAVGNGESVHRSEFFETPVTSFENMPNLRSSITLNARPNGADLPEPTALWLGLLPGTALAFLRRARSSGRRSPAVRR